MVGRQSLIEMESKDDHKTQLSQRRKTRREKTGKEWSAAASILHIWRACSARTHTNTRTYSMTWSNLKIPDCWLGITGPSEMAEMHSTYVGDAPCGKQRMQMMPSSALRVQVM